MKTLEDEQYVAIKACSPFLRFGEILIRLSLHKHTMPTTKKAGVLTEEPSMHW